MQRLAVASRNLRLPQRSGPQGVSEVLDCIPLHRARGSALSVGLGLMLALTACCTNDALAITACCTKAMHVEGRRDSV